MEILKHRFANLFVLRTNHDIYVYYIYIIIDYDNDNDNDCNKTCHGWIIFLI